MAYHDYSNCDGPLVVGAYNPRHSIYTNRILMLLTWNIALSV
jgi:hypothetical protein